MYHVNMRIKWPLSVQYNKLLGVLYFHVFLLCYDVASFTVRVRSETEKNTVLYFLKENRAFLTKISSRRFELTM